MTIILVNRDMNGPRNVKVNINGFSTGNGWYKTLQLSSLPANETFRSHTNNALKADSVSLDSGSLSITLPKLSTTAVLLVPGKTSEISQHAEPIGLRLFPNPVRNFVQLEMKGAHPGPLEINLLDQGGRILKTIRTNHDGCSALSIDLSSLSPGYYFLNVKTGSALCTKSLVLQK
jgi:hypothetical protein